MVDEVGEQVHVGEVPAEVRILLEALVVLVEIVDDLDVVHPDREEPEHARVPGTLGLACGVDRRVDVERDAARHRRRHDVVLLVEEPALDAVGRHLLPRRIVPAVERLLGKALPLHLEGLAVGELDDESRRAGDAAAGALHLAGS